MIGKFELVDIAKIPRSENYPTDILARMTTKTDKKKKKPKLVPIEVKSSPSIEQSLEIIQVK